MIGAVLGFVQGILVRLNGEGTDYRTNKGHTQSTYWRLGSETVRILLTQVAHSTQIVVDSTQNGDRFNTWKEKLM